MRAPPNVAPTFWLRAGASVARRPRLWPTAIGQLLRVAPKRWWTRRPYLPRPDPRYVSFRIETQYGAHGVPEPEDLVTYLEWCREQSCRERGHGTHPSVAEASLRRPARR